MDRHRFLAYCPFCELIAAAYAPHDRGGSSGSALLIGSIRLISISPSISQSSYLFAKIMFAKNIYRTTLSRREPPKRLRDYTERLPRKTIQRYPKRLDPEMLSNTIQKYLGRSSGHSIAIITKDDQMLDQRKIHYPVPLQFYCSSPAVLLWLSFLPFTVGSAIRLFT